MMSTYVRKDQRNHRLVHRLMIALLLCIPLLPQVAPAGPVHAASITVATTADELNTNGECSLREAVINANRDDQSGSSDCPAGSGDDVITIPAGTYTLSLLGPREGDSETGDLDVKGTLTIHGSGPQQTILKAGENAGDRVLHVHEGAVIGIDGVMFTNGKSPDGTDASDGVDGGGIYNERGTLTLINCVVSDNVAGTGGYGPATGGYGGNGGGIYNDEGTLTLVNSLVHSNRAGKGGTSRGVSGKGGNGGGIANKSGTVTILNSTLSGNAAGDGSCHPEGCREGGIGGDGGGIASDGGTITLLNTTISNNTAGNGASGTTAGTDGNGGGIVNDGGTMSINHTLLAGNHIGSDTNTNVTGSGPDCSGTIASQDYNLFGSTGGCTIEGTTEHNITAETPLLAPLGDNGGPSQTHALLPGSPAIDAGDAAFDAGSLVFPLAGDQRGEGYARVVNERVDIGAFEASPEIAVFFYEKDLITLPVVEFGTTPRGTAISYEFTIKNMYAESKPGSGTASLSLEQPTIPDGFSLVGEMPETVAPGQEAKFTLQLDAKESGSYEGDVVLPNNDNDEPSYTFSVVGAVAAGPEIEVWHGETNIKSTETLSDDRVIEFSYGVVGRAPIEETFTIKNVGTEDLLLDITTSSVPSGFQLGGLPPRVPSGSSREFIVTMNATQAGTVEGAVQIYNNDVDENPFTFHVRGKVVNPEDLQTVYLPLVVR